jgi:hypothetical protein
MSDLLDLSLYVEIGDFLDMRTAAGIIGGGQAASEWARDYGLEEDDLDYFMLGNARLAGHPKGEDWEQRARRPDLDKLVWTFHRAWVDRCGFEATNREAVKRYNQPPVVRGSG